MVRITGFHALHFGFDATMKHDFPLKSEPNYNLTGLLDHENFEISLHKYIPILIQVCENQIQDN
jgi:hypothetical protein